MTRTIITIPDELKMWLDAYSKKNNRPTAETIREAIKQYKENIESGNKDFLRETAGIWENKNIDSVKYVKRLREEW